MAGYTLGVSTGIFSIARSAEPESRHEYIGIPKKALWSITKGVNFSQVDLESISEFKEPDLEKQVRALERMGISIGIHGEAREYTQTLPFLDSALFEEWHRSHDRLLRCLEGAGEVHAKYFLLHASSSTSWQLLWRDFQPTVLADIWGRRLDAFLKAKENEDVLEWAVKSEPVMEVAIHGYRVSSPNLEKHKEAVFKEMMEDWKKAHEGKEPDEKERNKMKKDAGEAAEDSFKTILERFIVTSDQAYGSERVAYYIIAKWMQDGKSCPKQLKDMWKSMTGGGDIGEKRFREAKGGSEWVPAVTAAYTWGHFNTDSCPSWGGMEKPKDPKSILESNKLWFLLETPMTGAGEEEQMRLGKPTHIYELVKRMGSKWTGVVFDFEHQLSGGIDPMKEADELPEGGGRLVKVIHAGYPAVLAPAHVPIPLGSEAQKYIYDLLWKLKKKGFEEGWIIFERGSGTEPVKDTVLSLRKIKQYLESGVHPDKLPDDFYGLEKGGARLTRQEVAIKDHVMDPLKGMLMIPEEEYGFLSTAAAAKGKIEEWKKGELK